MPVQSLLRFILFNSSGEAGLPFTAPRELDWPVSKKNLQFFCRTHEKKAQEKYKRIENESFELHLPRDDYSCRNFSFSTVNYYP